MEDERAIPSLWTRDFTIITVGTVISMFGNAIGGFAMSLMVLDISKSTLLYAVYLAMFTIPQLIMPLFSGAILDRYSRKRTIYTLDFISAGMHIAMAAILATGWFSFPVFALFCFAIGSIESIYMVAYDSFYPLLVTGVFDPEHTRYRFDGHGACIGFSVQRDRHRASSGCQRNLFLRRCRNGNAHQNR